MTSETITRSHRIWRLRIDHYKHLLMGRWNGSEFHVRWVKRVDR